LSMSKIKNKYCIKKRCKHLRYRWIYYPWINSMTKWYQSQIKTWGFLELASLQTYIPAMSLSMLSRDWSQNLKGEFVQLPSSGSGSPPSCTSPVTRQSFKRSGNFRRKDISISKSTRWPNFEILLWFLSSTI
jgi:hypothetical protein